MFDFAVKIPTPLQKLKDLRDRCCRFSSRSQRKVMFGLGPKRSKSAPFYFRDTVDTELIKDQNRASPFLRGTPPPSNNGSKPWLFSSTPNSSPVSTPGYSRRNGADGRPLDAADHSSNGAAARSSPYRMSAPPVSRKIPHCASEPVMNTAALYRATVRQTIKQTSLCVLAPPAPTVMRVKNSPMRRPLSASLSPLYEEKRICSEECVVCALVRPDLRGRHSDVADFNPSRNFN